MSESLRGSIHAVSQGQWLAGTSLGLTRTQTLPYVIGPQALRPAVPNACRTA
jgi:cystine transport system permease protein